MGFRKRRLATPGYGHAPYNPIVGSQSNLLQSGTYPFCAMMQVAADDTYDDYVVCRGFDTRILKFIDYAEGDSNNPGISVAKPFGKRRTGTYEIGEIYPAFLPTQGNAGLGDFKQAVFVPPSPSDVQWRVGQNAGVVTGGLDGGQPENLTETIGILYDHNGKAVNWLLIDSKPDVGCERIKFSITAAVDGDSSDPCIDGSNEDFTGTVKLTVTIIGRICSSNTVSLGDTAYVYDDDGCLIGTEALEDLIGRTGWATAFVTGESEEAALCCHWSLDGLCCP